MRTKLGQSWDKNKRKVDRRLREKIKTKLGQNEKTNEYEVKRDSSKKWAQSCDKV